MAKIGYLQITRKCNQECMFCSNPPNENILTLDKAKETIDDFIKDGFDGIILTGGEPTLFDNLPELISYCNKKNIFPRIITNGQKTADQNFLKILIDAGLRHFHISIYSIKKEVQSFLSNNIESLDNIIKTLENCKKYKNLSININTVINKFNSDHLCENVKFLIGKYPFINHFVWNNLDPLMERVNMHKEVIPSFQDFELSLYNAVNYLKMKNKTFRIERVPLCYMAEFAECSTETRKIIKDEYRIIQFLDKRGKYYQDYFYYKKPWICKICTLNEICAGVYEGEKFYSYKEIYPVFINKEEIIRKILHAV